MPQPPRPPFTPGPPNKGNAKINRPVLKKGLPYRDRYTWTVETCHLRLIFSVTCGLVHRDPPPTRSGTPCLGPSWWAVGGSIVACLCLCLCPPEWSWVVHSVPSQRPVCRWPSQCHRGSPIEHSPVWLHSGTSRLRLKINICKYLLLPRVQQCAAAQVLVSELEREWMQLYWTFPTFLLAPLALRALDSTWEHAVSLTLTTGPLSGNAQLLRRRKLGQWSENTGAHYHHLARAYFSNFHWTQRMGWEESCKPKILRVRRWALVHNGTPQ